MHFQWCRLADRDHWRAQLNQGSRGKLRNWAELSPARCERLPCTGYLDSLWAHESLACASMPSGDRGREVVSDSCFMSCQRCTSVGEGCSGLAGSKVERS